MDLEISPKILYPNFKPSRREVQIEVQQKFKMKFKANSLSQTESD